MKWKLYAESSDQGSWEGDFTHFVFFERVSVLGGEEDLSPPFYYPYMYDVKGDTLVIADRSTQELVCMLTNGEVIWKAGGIGEGPGHFHGIGSIAILDYSIAVANDGLGRIDFFSWDGECYFTYPVPYPEYLITLSDSSLIILSGSNQNGIVKVRNFCTGEIRSLGNIDWNPEMVLDARFTDNLRGALLSPDTLAVVSRYDPRLFIFDLGTDELIFDGLRNMPSEPVEPYRRHDEESNQMYTLFLPPVNGIFIGPEGMINICFLYQSDGELLHSNRLNEYLPVTIVDRYDHTGNYLDSYCLPDSCLSYIQMLDDGRLIARQGTSGRMIIYEVIFPYR